MMHGESGGHFVMMNGWIMAMMNSCGDHVLDFWISVSPGPLVHDYYEGNGIVKVNAGAFPVVVDVQIHHPSCPGKVHVGGWCFLRGGKVSFSAYMQHIFTHLLFCPRPALLADAFANGNGSCGPSWFRS
jgi:hypothetical protein